MKVMPKRTRDRYLARKKALLTRALQRRLEELVGQDLALLSPASRERLRRVVDRLPRQIPSTLVAQLRHQLQTREVAA